MMSGECKLRAGILFRVVRVGYSIYLPISIEYLLIKVLMLEHGIGQIYWFAVDFYLVFGVVLSVFKA